MKIKRINVSLETKQLSNLKRNCSLTIGNYSKMANRLERRNNIFQFILVYYSIIGIIDALIPKYFNLDSLVPPLINIVFEFWDIIIAIVLLFFSSQIALFKYPERIKNCINSLNKLKNLRVGLEAAHKTTTEISELIEEYNKLTSNIDFLFSRSDFYFACKEYDKKNSNSTEPSEVEVHFGNFEIIYIITKSIFEYFIYFILIVLPIVMYIILVVSGYLFVSK